MNAWTLRVEGREGNKGDVGEEGTVEGRADTFRDLSKSRGVEVSTSINGLM